MDFCALALKSSDLNEVILYYKLVKTQNHFMRSNKTHDKTVVRVQLQFTLTNRFLKLQANPCKKLIESILNIYINNISHLCDTFS